MAPIAFGYCVCEKESLKGISPSAQPYAVYVHQAKADEWQEVRLTDSDRPSPIAHTLVTPPLLSLISSGGIYTYLSMTCQTGHQW